MYADTLDAFIGDCCETWRMQDESDMGLIMFVDNDHGMRIPCSSDATDKSLLKRVRCFYELTLARGGIAMFLGFRASSKIEIVKVSAPFITCSFRIAA